MIGVRCLFGAGRAGRPADSPEVGRQERNLRALLGVAATNNTAWNLVTPFMPLFILEIVHGDAVAAATWSGLALGVAPLMTAVAGPAWSLYSRHFGARSAMLRTLLMSPFLVVLIAFSTAVWQVIVLRFLVGVLGGFYILVHALAAQTAPRDRIGQAIGSLQAIQMVCLALVPPLVVEMEPGSEQVGLITGLLLGIGSAATALSALAVARLARRIPTRKLMLVSLLCGAVALPILAVSGSVWQFLGVRVVMGLLTGGLVTLAYAHVSTVLSSDDLGTSFGMFASVAMVASAVGPFSLSPLVALLGLRSPLLMGAVAFGVCAVLLVVTGRAGATQAVPRREPSAPGGTARHPHSADAVG